MSDKQSTLNNWNIWNIKDKELLNLIVGREGGKTTIKIMDEILSGPHNKNQLAKQLNMDYNTINHHVKIMYQHDYVTKEPFDNSFFFHPSPKLFNSLKEYKIIKKYMEDKK